MPPVLVLANWLVLLAVGLVACAAEPAPPAPPAPPPGALLWRGGFETGDLFQWKLEDGGLGAQDVAPDRIRVVQDPVRDGRYAARFEVRQGDQWRESSGDRAELIHWTAESQGDARWYGWSTMFAEDYPYDDRNGWQIWTQWHSTGSAAQPPLYFFASGDTIGLKSVAFDANGSALESVTHWRAEMDRGDWHDLRLHVEWSADPERGSITLWHDGELVVPTTRLATLAPDGAANYLKQGLYRSPDIPQTAVIFHDAMVMTRDARAPAPA